MAKCMKKYEGVPDIAVVELAELGGDGERTRPRMPAVATVKKEEETISQTEEKRSRKVGDGELDFASEFVERRSTRRRVVIEAAKESSSLADRLAGCGPLTSVVETNSASEPASCCSSNASTELVRDRSAIADPTVTSVRTETSDGETESAQIETLTFSGGRERISCPRLKPCRSEATPSSEPIEEESGDLESTAAARPMAEANSRFKSTVNEMPSESEIEEFFSAAEKNLQKSVSEKYNFDVVKGVPLEGRYEWVRVNP